MILIVNIPFFQTVIFSATKPIHYIITLLTFTDKNQLLPINFTLSIWRLISLIATS